MDLWNVKDLEPPPVNSCKMTTKEIDLRLLDIALKEGINFFQNQIHLDTEAALISRVVYRSKMKFRNSKDFKSVEKLSRTLRNYQHLDIPRILKTLLDSMPRNYKMNQFYMLTKNMMDYVLVRLQGLGKTLCRVLDICKVAATLMGQRIRLGHFWKIAIVMFASMSRVSVLTKNVLKYTCELYTKLLPFSSSLGNAGVRWLPEDYVFPSRLDDWLDINWLDLENNVIEIPDDEQSLSYLRLADSDDDDVEFCDEYILIKDDTILDGDTDLEESPEFTENLTEQDDSSVDIVEGSTEDAEEVDVGEVIALSDTDSTTPTKRKRIRKKKGAQRIETEEGDVELLVNANTPSRKKKRKRSEKVSGNVSTSGALLNDNTPRHKKKRISEVSGNVSTSVALLSANKPGHKKKRKSTELGFGNVSKSEMNFNQTISLLASTPKPKRKRKGLKSISNNSKSRISSLNSTKGRKKKSARKKKRLS